MALTGFTGVALEQMNAAVLELARSAWLIKETVGATGPIGLLGPTGLQGEQGDLGPRGLAFSDGTGPTGPTGLQGERGITGPTASQFLHSQIAMLRANTGIVQTG